MSQDLCPEYDKDAYMAIFLGGEAWEMCLSVGSIKKLDPFLNSSLANVFFLNNHDPTLMIINHILTIS